jgi:hypothetical protein
VSRLTDYLTEETPESYIPLADAIFPSASSLDGSSSAPAWQTYVSAAVGSKGGLFDYLKGVMEGPLFVDVDTKNGAMPADLNSLGYRSVFKGETAHHFPRFRKGQHAELHLPLQVLSSP